MIELQTLGPVGGQQQQPVLPAAGIPSPLGKPLLEVDQRRGGPAGLGVVLVDRVGQQLDPWSARLAVAPRRARRVPDQAGPASA